MDETSFFYLIWIFLLIMSVSQKFYIIIDVFGFLSILFIRSICYFILYLNSLLSSLMISFVKNVKLDNINGSLLYLSISFECVDSVIGFSIWSINNSIIIHL